MYKMYTHNFTATKVIFPVDVGRSVLVSVSNENVKGFKESPFLKNSQSPLLRMNRHKRDGITCREAEDRQGWPSQMPRDSLTEVSQQTGLPVVSDVRCIP